MASVPLTNAADIVSPAIEIGGLSVRMLTVGEASSNEFIALWSTLANGASEPNAFLEPWFLLPSIQSLGKGQELCLFALFEGPELTGLLPLQSAKRYYQYPIPHLAAWGHENMFCSAPLVAKGYEREFWRALLGKLDEKPGLALFFHISGIRADGPLASGLADILAEQKRQGAIVHSHERAMLASGLKSEEYFEGALPNKKRKELRRQHRRLGELGELTFERSQNTDNLAQWTQEFLLLEKAGWKGEQGSALADRKETQEFFTSVIALAGREGRLERLTLRLDDKPISMLANFIASPGSFAFKTVFDEDYARFSPGVLLQKENLALLDRDDIAWCDSCAAAGHPMIERIWREKRRMISASVAIGAPLRQRLFAGLLKAETHQDFGVLRA